MKAKTVFSLAVHDIRAKYAGSALGVLWELAEPLVTAGIYWFVYTVALGGGAVEHIPYALWLMTGIAPWFFLAGSLNGAAVCFHDYRFLVRKTKFHAELLPAVRVCSAALSHGIFLFLLYFILCFSGFRPCLGQLWMFYWLLAGGALHLGLGTILALCCVYLKDVAYAVKVLIQLGFWLTPVFWNPAALPESFRWITIWNPAAVLVQGYREALLYGRNLAWQTQALFWGIAGICGIAAWLLMKKCRPFLADYL